MLNRHTQRELPKDFPTASIQIICHFGDHGGPQWEAILESKKDHNLIIYNILKNIPNLLQYYIQKFQGYTHSQIIGIFLSLLIEKLHDEKKVINIIMFLF